MEPTIIKNMEEVLSSAFLEYAGYNLQRRAIPDARDGLKWGARQLLHAQMLGKFTYDKPFKKAIKSVSQAMGFSYVHGDASAYGTFIRMAKPFVMNVPLQEAKGNYGTLINPDDHSASRYVEMRGSAAAAALLKDLDKDTILEWEDTYDLEGKFPKVLPAKGFWNLVNGCISIGSGMSCSIPPLNLRETNEALIKLLWNPDISDEELIVFPDFPTKATILNRDEVFNSLKNDTGSACKIRAKVEWDNAERCFIVKELPYSTYTNTICKELANIINEEPEVGIINIEDYTGTEPDLRIYLKKTANPDKVLRYLYKNTSLENHFNINMTVLDKGITPKVMGQRELFQAHLDHEELVYRRGFEFDFKKINARIHIIEGLLKAYDIIDEVVQTIKTSASSAAANEALRNLLGIDEVQAKAILDLKLSKLSKLDINKLCNEKSNLENEAARIEAILNDINLLKKEIEKGLREVAEKFGDERRTKILNLVEENDEPIEIKTLQISLTNQNNIFVSEVSSLYTQKRGGVGNKLKMEKGEYIISTLSVETNETILLFTNDGDFYSYNGTNLPIGEKIHIESLINLKNHQKVKAIASINEKNNNNFILFITKNGYIKKSEFSEYNTNRSIGIRAITLDKNDEITNVLFTNNDKVGIVTEFGNFIIIETKDIRPIGRVTRGIKAIKLNDGDFVSQAHLIPYSTKEILSISNSGFCKRTDVKEFSVQGKNTKGSKIQKLIEGDLIADFAPITSEKEILIAATSSCIKLLINDIPSTSKNTQGNKTIKLSSNDLVIGLSIY